VHGLEGSGQWEGREEREEREEREDVACWIKKTSDVARLSLSSASLKEYYICWYVGSKGAGLGLGWGQRLREMSQLIFNMGRVEGGSHPCIECHHPK
jgi:hypothetical protein